ncbi:serine hydrolase domain-containing protein [Jiangella anatolica]|uniref:Beta-lactamase-related domain-containing protein n=1 Tax=Jiangella anatolica TaxID=2670374 RepID=A0A2W2BAU4_9ACTN|nr:serine hydrolase domain-containing protein [Jiangella anatolica]PZF82360.1 hypothetical protein C1I92_17190 [Jiangella anatolica]
MSTQSLVSEAVELLERAVAGIVDRGVAPGAVGGILADGAITVAASGVGDPTVGDAVGERTLFQIGSVTKVVTTTIAMRLVDAGQLDLDAPVAAYLPELRLAGRSTEGLIVRHLLTHESGIEGDVYLDTGGGPDALERLVERLADVGTVHEPGAAWSYSNIGFVLAGRIAEKLTGLAFPEVVRTLVTEPLGIATPVVLADDALSHHCAVGHRRRDGALVPSPLRELPVSMAPAGSRPFCAIGDLLRFAASHFDGADDLLTEKSRLLMRRRWLAQPRSVGAGQGLGWFVLRDGPDPLLAHAGDTFGFGAMLVVAPARRFAVAIAGSTPDVADVAAGLAFQVCAAATGLTPQLVSSAPLASAELAHLAGRYERFGVVCDVGLEGTGLRIRTGYHGVRAGTPSTDERVEMVGEWIFGPKGSSGLFGYEFPGGANDRMYAHGRLLTRATA